MPDALLEEYDFWRLEEHKERGEGGVDAEVVLRGYPKHPSTAAGEYIIDVVCKKVFYDDNGKRDVAVECGAWDMEATITRRRLVYSDAELLLPAQEASSADGFHKGAAYFSPSSGRRKIIGIEQEGQRLLNPLRAGPSSVLRRLGDVMARLDYLSQVLMWSNSVAVESEECEISVVELPRLKTSFVPKQDRDGQVRLYSKDFGDLFISDTRSGPLRRLLEGVPRSVILENNTRYHSSALSYRL